MGGVDKAYALFLAAVCATVASLFAYSLGGMEGYHQGKWAERCRYAQCDAGPAKWDGDAACVCKAKLRLK